MLDILPYDVLLSLLQVLPTAQDRAALRWTCHSTLHAMTPPEFWSYMCTMEGIPPPRDDTPGWRGWAGAYHRLRPKCRACQVNAFAERCPLRHCGLCCQAPHCTRHHQQRLLRDANAYQWFSDSDSLGSDFYPSEASEGGGY